MPKVVEKRLLKQAHKKGYIGARAKRYVYGTMNKLGLLHPKRKRL